MVIHLNEYPPSTNVIWRVARNRIIKSAAYRQWLSSQTEFIHSQNRKKLIGSYSLEIIVRRKDKRRRDIDNFIKPISDLLVTSGMVEDDSLCHIVAATWGDFGSEITLLLHHVDLTGEI